MSIINLDRHLWLYMQGDSGSDTTLAHIEYIVGEYSSVVYIGSRGINTLRKEGLGLRLTSETTEG